MKKVAREAPSKRTASTSKRDPTATKRRILAAALSEFGSKGYGGARMAKIATRARCNIRMLYHYYDSKQRLYLACLERVYEHIRKEERALDLLSLPPEEAILELVHFTFDHMRNNQDFVQIAGVENTQKGHFLKRLTPVRSAAFDHIRIVREVIARGQKAKLFRDDIDPIQLYVSILALSYLHLSNRYTLSVTYDTDLGDAGWLESRRDHVSDMVLSFVKK